MVRLVACLVCLLAVVAQETSKAKYPSFDYDTARSHEIEPHRRTIPFEGVRPGFNQLRLTLTVSPAGDVIGAEAGGEKPSLDIWPSLEGEVRQWKFEPFEENGKATTATVEEYIDLVPPERLPQVHVPAPVVRPDSQVTIALERSGCYGTCPSYTVTVSTDGIVFDGRGFVVATGKHAAPVKSDKVRDFAQDFFAADFYSMDSAYQASVTDNPSYVLSIDIDGRKKEILDYVGSWVRMPAVITRLENEVDTFTDTGRWVKGSDGLVESLKAEKFDFKTFDAQVMLKEAATRGETETVQDLIEAGVPIKPLPAPKRKDSNALVPVQFVGWLTAASSYPETLQAFIDVEASKSDQKDKDLALVGAARSGKVDAVQALIAYGANPNADLHKLAVPEDSSGMTMQLQGAESILIYAAESGNPEMVREILRYHPSLEARDHEGQTALFAAGGDEHQADEDARAECVRLLIQAGANVNARDHDGNTALHETYLTPVEEELLKSGADVNARNKDGETPIFTTVDDEAIPLFIKHGADLTIRNKKGETVVEAAQEKGPARQEVLRKALQEMNKR
jgi:ankyrin repeat protein